MRAFSIFAASALALGVAAAVNSADAGCKRFGFTVNDYGKEGPTNDAKALLDKHVTKWAAESGISDYRVGKKDVKCELFLDFVVFDEYTCTASANVCWGADISKIAPSASDGDVAMENEKPPAPVSKVAAGLKREKPAAQTATADAPAEAASDESATADAAPQAPAAETQAATAEPAAPPAVEPPAATASVTPVSTPDDAKPDVAVSTGAPVVETGALGQNSMPDAKSMAPAGDSMAATEDADQSAAASSAAAAAAAAAERAAAAAETAAAAAKEAAAAAVAASAANRGVIVPPLDNP